jgi:hypothetical protein
MDINLNMDIYITRYHVILWNKIDLLSCGLYMWIHLQILVNVNLWVNDTRTWVFMVTGKEITQLATLQNLFEFWSYK